MYVKEGFITCKYSPYRQSSVKAAHTLEKYIKIQAAHSLSGSWGQEVAASPPALQAEGPAQQNEVIRHLLRSIDRLRDLPDNDKHDA
jgi:hypothetical protein